jgi:catechol 2,3-dioxygenase-like lactoylglutathione lyase family enzyme
VPSAPISDDGCVIDHVHINVSDFDGAPALYTQALEPLGVKVIMEFPGTAGLGNTPKPDLWISERDEPSSPVHVAITAPDRPTVDAFHEAAIAAGGTDNGAPGERPQYHSNYYGAFVLDPDGNNIEAVCHGPA